MHSPYFAFNKGVGNDEDTGEQGGVSGTRSR